MNSLARLAIALQKSRFINMAVHHPIPNCSPVDQYVSPVASRHNATTTCLCTGIDCRSLVSFFTISGPAKRTINSKVRLASFVNLLTKHPFSRFSNQNWFLGQDQAHLACLLFRCISCSKIISFASLSRGVVVLAVAIIETLLLASQELKRKGNDYQSHRFLVNTDHDLKLRALACISRQFDFWQC